MSLLALLKLRIAKSLLPKGTERAPVSSVALFACILGSCALLGSGWTAAEAQSLLLPPAAPAVAHARKQNHKQDKKQDKTHGHAQSQSQTSKQPQNNATLGQAGLEGLTALTPSAPSPSFDPCMVDGIPVAHPPSPHPPSPHAPKARARQKPTTAKQARPKQTQPEQTPPE